MGFPDQLLPSLVKLVAAVKDSLPPVGVVEIPVHGFPETGGEAFLWLPAQFGRDFCGVHCIAKIMSGPIIDEVDQVFVRCIGRL